MLRATELNKTYGTGVEATKALREVGLTLDKGEMAAVTGPSGCGKSTLLHVLAGLEPVDGGEIWIGDEAVHRRRESELAALRLKRMGFVFQAYHLVPVLSAEENVQLPLLAGGMSRREAERQALEALDLVGLAAKRRARPSALSGGQSQRVAIARAVAGRPDILFADEPTGALDSDAADQVIGLLELMNRQYGMTLLLVTHDDRLAQRLPRQIRMFNGRIVEDRGGSSC
ncbi:ABC transporter ATP-binding protein [Paenibacillus pasadenensis]|uniref:Methionine ABC transporter ATP-binding protein n=1 Tax=Paenibacillus pasadenensis TaxID=217090 RepID=A0A2N5N6N5_9BACL|nr:ABC transporter ATP-binding protein [Paenibacillus pasadenensis]PLT45985.1 Methionine ABC transporter ATP-binding protein [Paenibacillus pasadenensis]